MKKYFFPLLFLSFLSFHAVAQKLITIESISVPENQINTSKTVYVDPFVNKRLEPSDKNNIGHLTNAGNVKKLFNIADFEETVSLKIKEGLLMKNIKVINDKSNADYVLKGEIEKFYLSWIQGIGTATCSVTSLKIKYSLTDVKTDKIMWESTKEPVYTRTELRKMLNKAGTPKRFMQRASTSNVERNLVLLFSDAEFIKVLQ